MLPSERFITNIPGVPVRMKSGLVKTGGSTQLFVLEQAKTLICVDNIRHYVSYLAKKYAQLQEMEVGVFILLIF